MVSDEVPSVHDLGEVGPAPARIVDPFDVEDIAAGLAAVLTDDASGLISPGAVHAVPRALATVAREHVALWRSLR